MGTSGGAFFFFLLYWRFGFAGLFAGESIESREDKLVGGGVFIVFIVEYCGWFGRFWGAAAEL